MKININPSTITPTYSDNTITNIVPEQLNTIENNSCEEIMLNQTLDYVIDRQSLLVTCINKLRLNGVLFFSGLDILEVSKQIITGEITIEKTNELLYKNRQSIDNLFRIINILHNLGVSIEEKRLINLEYAIKIKKVS
jgi:hypothetical protein